eukprot:s3214_g5.t1
MGDLRLVHALGLEIPSQKLLDRLGDQVLNPPRPRVRIPQPRNQLHLYQGNPVDSDSEDDYDDDDDDDEEDDEDHEDYEDYLMAIAPNAIPGQAIGPAIEGAKVVDGTGNLAATTGESKRSAEIQDEMTAAAQAAAQKADAGYGTSASKPPGVGFNRNEVTNDEFGMSSNESSSVSPRIGVEVGR